MLNRKKLLNEESSYKYRIKTDNLVLVRALSHVRRGYEYLFKVLSETTSSNSITPMVRKLFLVYFERREDPNNDLDKHVALFVKADGAEEGPLMHAIENHDRITEDTLVLSFDERHGDPKRHRSYLSERHIGTIADDKVESLRNICKNMPDVIAPQVSRKPDCVTWLDNVLYDLHKHHIASFNRGFKVPTEKKPLQVSTGERQKHAGSSSSKKSKK